MTDPLGPADHAAIARYLGVLRDSRNGIDARTVAAFERLTPAQLDLILERLAAPAGAGAAAAPAASAACAPVTKIEAAAKSETSEAPGARIRRRFFGGASARDIRSTGRITGLALALFAVVIGTGAVIAATTTPAPMAGPTEHSISDGSFGTDSAEDLAAQLRQAALLDQQTGLDY
ncbi:hypothetical protein D9V32_01215 [Mycetocola tolaasinivorans]|uniref:Uncharacterized protein n=1 Tax=Mycetocola tolaasinivorans TaxID=76635 RepID=A0A3L7ADU9_9MICO|nr:hypothetical protein [Mycetocola tolaasinivorans]RLP77980.1 hypothetical protein D9V32_01215 [Mycetocola tolaasinivorans]